MKKLIIILFLVLILIVAGCGKSGEVKQPEQMQVQSQEEVAVKEKPAVQVETEETFQPEAGSIAPVVEAVKEFTVHGVSFEFDRQEIRVKKGDRVKITYISDDIGHDLVIDELGVRTKVITKGQTEVVEFTADKAGEFSMYCSVGQHRQLGMESKLIVEP